MNGQFRRGGTADTLVPSFPVRCLTGLVAVLHEVASAAGAQWLILGTAEGNSNKWMQTAEKGYPNFEVDNGYLPG